MATAIKPVAQDDTLQRVADALETIADNGQSLGITNASVGESPVISQVDENGKPTEWIAEQLAKDGEVYHEWRLVYDGTNIKKDNVVQTFAEIAEAIEDKTKFVYVVADNRLFIPQYHDASLVSFSCSYLDGTTPTIRRIRMTSAGAITTATETSYTKTETDAKYAKKDDIPTKTSELNNDSGFITDNNQFWAVFGVTTAEEITQAYNDGKAIFVDHNNIQYQLTYGDNSYWYFGSIYATTSHYIRVTKNTDAWVGTTLTLQNVSNLKKSTSSSESTDNNYYSALATDKLLKGKQDTISDLEDIRSGAEDGATAVQPSAISDMATKTWTTQQGYLTLDTLPRYDGGVE